MHIARCICGLVLQKLEWRDYHMPQIACRYLCPCFHNTGVWRMHRRTDGHTIGPIACNACPSVARNSNWISFRCTVARLKWQSSAAMHQRRRSVAGEQCCCTTAINNAYDVTGNFGVIKGREPGIAHF